MGGGVLASRRRHPARRRPKGRLATEQVFPRPPSQEATPPGASTAVRIARSTLWRALRVGRKLECVVDRRIEESGDLDDLAAAQREHVERAEPKSRTVRVALVAV